MTRTAPHIGADIRRFPQTRRVRPWIALAAAAVLFALVVFGFVPFTSAHLLSVGAGAWSRPTMW